MRLGLVGQMLGFGGHRLRHGSDGSLERESLPLSFSLSASLCFSISITAFLSLFLFLWYDFLCLKPLTEAILPHSAMVHL